MEPEWKLLDLALCVKPIMPPFPRRGERVAGREREHPPLQAVPGYHQERRAATASASAAVQARTRMAASGLGVRSGRLIVSSSAAVLDSTPPSPRRWRGEEEARER